VSPVLKARILLGVLVAACGGEAPPPAPEPAGSDPADAAVAEQAVHRAPGAALTEAGRYRVSLAPEAGRVPLGELHAWEVQVATPEGAPVTPTRLAFDGGMPQHGHGLTTAPRVTEALGGGRYRVEGVRFHMHGDWRLVVELVGPAGPDVAVFHVDVAP